jgi:hypothetical protein
MHNHSATTLLCFQEYHSNIHTYSSESNLISKNEPTERYPRSTDVYIMQCILRMQL